MRVSLTNTWLDPDPLSVPVRMLKRVLLDGNDSVTTADKTDASRAKGDHACNEFPYLKYNGCGKVDSYTGNDTFVSESGSSELAKTKVCSGCGERKLLTEFYRRHASPDGLQSACRVCQRVRQARSVAANPDSYAENRRAATARYRAKNRSVVD